MIGEPYLALGGALALCLTAGGAFAYGVHVGTATEQAAEAKAASAAEAQRQKDQAQIDASATAFQTAETARQTSVRDITHETQKIIDRPVYRTTCVDPDGVGLLDRAADTANGARRPDPAGPAADATQSPAGG